MSLRIAELTLSHFRSHRTSRIEADGRPVVLFGPNGAGKTNVLEAISMLSPGRGLRRARPEELARSQQAIGWRVSAVLHSLGQVHEIKTGATDAARTVEIDAKTAPQVALGRIARILWLVPVMDRLWLEGASERRRFLDRMALSFEPLHAEATLAYERAMRERNRLLKDGVSDAGWYQALEAQMAEQGLRIMANRALTLDRLTSAQAAVQTGFPVAELSIETGETAAPPETRDDLATALAEGRRRDMAAGRTLTGPHRDDLGAVYAAKGMAARNCSTGEQKALLVSLILANARAVAEDFGAPPILLLDEVAAHLDEGRRAALYEELLRLGAQAWMTGTGDELFGELGDRAQHIAVSEEAGETQLETMT